MQAKDLTFEQIAIGDTTTFTRTITASDIDTFASLSGDSNPLHVDEEYARTTPFGKRVVHGMLLGALCSQLVGMHIPGKRCLYLKQDLSFKNPVFIGDTVVVMGTVTHRSESTRILTILIQISVGEKEVARGEAHVQVVY
jgi:3-hydroxybutyryl-CoA dehydratase